MTSILNGRMTIKRVVTYGVVGILAFASEYLCFLCLIHFLASPYSLLVAQSLSFSVGLIVSFTGNRLFSFNDAGRTYSHDIQKQVGLYLVLATINLLLSNVIIQLLVNSFSFVPVIAKLVVMCIVVLWNFIIFNKLIFRSD